ncbi:MAG: peptide ABC transporter substrate-binding protein [Tepidisphaerales bacterium]
MNKWLCLAAWVLTWAALSLGCDRSGDAGEVRPPDRSEFRFINRNDVITLDLNQMSYMQDFRVTYAIREGLYTYEPQTMRAIPALVEEERVSPDQRTWTFRLREARWSNGDPVTAHDFVFSWRHMLRAPGEYTSLFYYIKNAEAYERAYVAGEPFPESELGFRALDDRTLEVTLVNPVSFLRDLLAFPPFYPRHEASMEPFKVVDARGRVTYRPEYTRPSSRPGEPGVVTNGPFVLTQWEFGRHLVFQRSETYWDRANVKSEGLRMVVVTDPQQAFNMYERGEVDWVTDPSPQIAVDLRQLGRRDLQVGPGFGTHFITVNVAPQIPGVLSGSNPLADLRVRQALNLAIDKQGIVDTITRMGERPARNYIPPGLFEGFEAREGPGMDVERARALLAEAGFPGGRGFPSLPIIFNTDSAVRPAVAQYLKNQWERTLGIPIEVKGIELKGYRAAIKQKEYALALVAWFGDYTDPSTFTDKYRSTSQNNDSNWAVPEYDALLDRAAAETDPVARFRLLEQAEDMINEQLPIIPLWHAVAVTLVKPYVEGLYLNPKQLTMWKPVHIRRGP